MGELQSLLLVLSLIYLSECLVWVRRGAAAFANWWSPNYSIRHPGTLAGNHRGGWLLANPFPPLDGLFLAAPLPFSLSPQAVYAYCSACLNPAGRPPHTGKLLHWDKFQSIRIHSRNLEVNGELFLTAFSTFAARRAGELLRRLAKLNPPDRAGEFRRALLATLDATKIARRLEEYRKLSRPIRLLANPLFVYLFVIVPPFLWRYGFGAPGLGLLAGMLAFTVPIAVLFRRAHRSLFPDAEEERFKPFLTMLLAPPAAIRAPDLLGRHLLEEFHPLGIARVLASPARFRRLADQLLRDLRYPLFPVCPTTEPVAVQTEEWFRLALLEAVEKFLAKEGLDPHQLAAPPKPSEPVNVSFCPRCQAQFVRRDGACADCGGRPLQAFSSAPEASRSLS